MGSGLGVIATAFVFGLRHGFDWDHVAAITDIAGAQRRPRTSLLYCTLYAAGHAAMVVALGVLAIWVGDFLPSGVDAAMERIVGATLILLGIYVLYSFFTREGDFRARSRWMLLISLVRRLVLRRRRAVEQQPVVIEHDHEHPAEEPHGHPGPPIAGPSVGRSALALARKTHRHPHVHVGTMPQDPFIEYGRVTAFGIGVLHGIGAETPTQVLVFIAAAGIDERAAGLLLLASFVVGLLLSNTALALMSTFGMGNGTRGRRVYLGITATTAAFSFVVGALMLLGKGTALPVLFA